MCINNNNKTVGSVLKEKFGNFVVFCTTKLPISNECTLQLQKMDNLPVEVLVALFIEYLIPCREMIANTDLKALETRLQTQIADSQLTLFSMLFKASNLEQTALIWRYLNCFLELVSE